MAFYIDKKGRRARPEWMIRWEGQPTAFALNYPYIAAFDSTFIEVRDMDTVTFLFFSFIFPQLIPFPILCVSFFS